MLQCFFTVMMARTLVPVYIFHALNSISFPQDKVLLSSASKQCWFSNAQRTPTHIQLASHGICWNTATTRKQAVARLFRQLLGHMETPGCPGRWKGELYLETPCFHFTKEEFKYHFSIWEKPILCITYKKPPKEKNQKLTLSLFIKFRACSISVHANMHLAKAST